MRLALTFLFENYAFLASQCSLVLRNPKNVDFIRCEVSWASAMFWDPHPAREVRESRFHPFYPPYALPVCHTDSISCISTQKRGYYRPNKPYKGRMLYRSILEATLIDPFRPLAKIGDLVCGSFCGWINPPIIQ